MKPGDADNLFRSFINEKFDLSDFDDRRPYKPNSPVGEGSSAYLPAISNQTDEVVFQKPPQDHKHRDKLLMFRGMRNPDSPEYLEAVNFFESCNRCTNEIQEMAESFMERFGASNEIDED